MKKLKIEQLKVKSFVTEMPTGKSETVKVQGGASATVCGKHECPTVVTFGYWTYCCEDSGTYCQ
ncbi:pinensin family lanthipeptide [Fulvivirga ulvae]|uniref:pinensin family lanthipeptide n=1 Tax=Fulvivirga ulvae TaxID=2904245 RepID=UPI001F323A9A|nr:pinensin family lanthipeptide [Fulvivirga ulvae]UII30785.1 pinensin family lanthipeptide [Fulvivirga ulvae]